MLTISHQDHTIELRPDTLIIIEDATPEMYELLADEDLKLDYDGVRLYIHSPATKEHEKLMFKLYTIIDRYLENDPGKGEVLGAHFSIKLPGGQQTEPDILVVPPGAVSPKEYEYTGVPYLIIEILSPSPSTRFHDLTKKKEWYAANQVPEFWFVDPEAKEILTYYLNSDINDYDESRINQGIILSKQFEDLQISMESLFPTS
jgi:Uma2 family endonuclease